MTEQTTTKTYVITNRKATLRGHGFTGVDLPGNFRYGSEIDVVVTMQNGRFVEKRMTGRMSKFYPAEYAWTEDKFFQSVEEKAVIAPKVVKQLKAAIPEDGFDGAIRVTVEA